jgi:uncharacterized membrane protein HdeD (DUF308 family)
MSDTAMRLTAVETLRHHWGWFLALGIVFVIGGVFAIAAPFIATLLVTVFIAAAMLVVGVVQIIQAFQVRSWGGFIWQLIIGLVIAAGGVVIYINPIAGAAWLTLFVAAVFVAKGVFQLIMGFQMRPHEGWGWIVAAGVIAIIVGLLIWFQWPLSTVYALGVLAGISFIFTGWSYIFVSLAARRLATA